MESLTLDVLFVVPTGVCGGTDTHSGRDWRVRHAAEEEVSDPTNAGAVKWRNINGRVSDMVNYAAGLQRGHIVRLFLHSGIENFYLTVRFRPTPGGKVKRGESLVKAIEA